MSFASCLLHLERGMMAPKIFYTTKQWITYNFGHHLDNIRSSIQRSTSLVDSEMRFFDSMMHGKINTREFPLSNNSYLARGSSSDMLYSLCCSLEPKGFCLGSSQLLNLRQNCKSYIHRMLSVLGMERLRCLNDMKMHDLYSIRFKSFQIAPPAEPNPDCYRCCRKSDSAEYFECAFHLACTFMELKHSSKAQKWDRPIEINSRDELEMLAKVVLLLRPVDRLVARLRVQGVAENFPLISMGDLVRFRFTGMDKVNEIVGEVADVVVKTEIVSVFLPPPFHEGIAIPDIFPYLQAILRTETDFVDAAALIQKQMLLQQNLDIMQIHRHIRASSNDMFKAEKINKEHKHMGHCDLRVGFLGGRGFDIVTNVLLNSVQCEEQKIAPIGCNKKKGRNKETSHLSRVIAPTHLHCDSIFRPLYGHPKPSIERWVHPLNQKQKNAILDIVLNNHGMAPYIIFGPVGTGKTLTVCEAVIQVLRFHRNAKILVCAPSDAACDVLASRLLPILNKEESNRSLLRINWWSRKASSLPPELLQCTPMNSDGIFVIPPKERVLAASVLVCQCFVAGCLDLGDPFFSIENHFTHLFIDETSQAMECEALVPLLKVGVSCSIILAGDPKQLGPTIRDPVAAYLGLSISIQERLMRLPLYRQSCNEQVITRLTGNYRSHAALLTVPSSLFYGGNLQCLAPEKVTSPYINFGELGHAKFPFMLYNVCEGKEGNVMDVPSFYNLEEIKGIIGIIQGLLQSKKIESAGGVSTDEIAVITPFRAQVLMLRTRLRLSGLGSINVGVVEDFQGQEMSIVIISTVLTKTHKRWSCIPKGNAIGTKLGFMHDPKRFNVAITRAHALCIVVGHAKFLRESGTYWTALIEHIQRNGGIINSKKDGLLEDTHQNLNKHESHGAFGVQKLIERVEELKLLGSGYEEEKYDLSVYYEDAPQWKVMLT